MRKKPTGVGTLLIASLTFSAPVRAQDHLVSPADVSARLARAAAERRAAVAILDGILSSAAVREATSRVGLDANRARASLTHLRDAEASDLAARARTLGVDPASAGLNGWHITLIVVGGVLLVLVAYVLYAISTLEG